MLVDRDGEDPLTAYVFVTATMSIAPRPAEQLHHFRKVAESIFLSWNIWRPKRMTAASFSSTPVGARLL